MWMEVYRSSGIQILPDQPLVEQHGVLVVVALPGHEADQDVLAQGDLALLGGGAVRQDGGIVAAVDPLAHVDDGPLVDAGGVVGAEELGELIILNLAAVILDGDVAGVHRGHHAVALGQDHDLGVDADLVLHAGANDGRMGPQQRHGLTLHVGAHQGAVGVVVWQEGDHSGGDGDHHPGGHIDVVHPLLVHLHDLVPVPGRDTGVDEAAVLVQRLSSLADDVVVLLVGGHAISPCSVAGPSARTVGSSPPWTRSPTSTMGRWLMQVVWLERRYLVSL